MSARRARRGDVTIMAVQLSSFFGGSCCSIPCGQVIAHAPDIMGVASRHPVSPPTMVPCTPTRTLVRPALDDNQLLRWNVLVAPRMDCILLHRDDVLGYDEHRAVCLEKVAHCHFDHRPWLHCAAVPCPLSLSSLLMLHLPLPVPSLCTAVSVSPHHAG